VVRREVGCPSFWEGRATMRLSRRAAALVTLACAVIGALMLTASAGSATQTQRYDISTLAGKVASLHGTAGLQIRFSAFIEQEATDSAAPPVATPITPTFVLGSPLDGNTVQPPDVTVNQDTAGAPQNETAIENDTTNKNH